MAIRSEPSSKPSGFADETMPDPFPDPLEESFDLDALAGGWFAGSADPHYADLPCYVPLIDDHGLEPVALEGRCANEWPQDTRVRPPRREH